MFDYARDMPGCIKDLIQKVDSKQLQSFVDNGNTFAKGPFNSMESIFDAVEVVIPKRCILSLDTKS